MSGETERIEKMMHSGYNGYGNGVMTSASAATTPMAMTLSSSSTNAQSRGLKTYFKNPEGRYMLYFVLMSLFWDFLFLCNSPEARFSNFCLARNRLMHKQKDKRREKKIDTVAVNGSAKKKPCCNDIGGAFKECTGETQSQEGEVINSDDEEEEFK